jgi:outer membrane autotransporter protein
LKSGSKQPLLGAATSNEISITILDDDVQLLVSPEPELNLSATVGETASGSFTISNPSTVAAITGLIIDISQFESPLTAEVGDCPSTLAAGENCVVTVAFAPDTAGAVSAPLIVSYDQGADILRQVNATANAEPALLSVSPVENQQRTVDIGEPGSVIWTVTNNGGTATTDLAVTAQFALAQTQAPESFDIDNRCPVNLAPQASCEIEATFTPAVSGSNSVAIEVSAAEQVLSRSLLVEVLARPTVTVNLFASQATVAEGGSGAGNTADFSIQLDAPADQAIVVTVATVNGIGVSGAVAGSDFTGIVDRQISIAAGLVRADFSVDINGDTTAELDETFDVVITDIDAAGADILQGATQSTVTIQDDDTLPAELIATRLTFPEPVDAGVTSSVEFQLSIENVSGSASVPAFAAGDITLAGSTLTGLIDVSGSALGQSCVGQPLGPIASGDTLQCFLTAQITPGSSLQGAVSDTLAINYFDGIQQRSTSVEFAADVVALAPVGKIVFSSEQSGTITAATSTTELLVIRSAGERGELQVTVEMDGSAVEGVDYQLIGDRTLNWSDGDSTGRSLRIDWLTPVALSDRQLIVRLTDPLFDGAADSNVLGTPNTQTFTLQALSPGQVRFAMQDMAFNEADGNQRIEVQRVGAEGGVLLVDFEVLPGASATGNGVDFAFTSDARTLRFEDSDTAAIEIDLIADAVPDPDETLSLRLLNPRLLSADGTEQPLADGLGSPAQADIVIRDQTQPSVISLATSGGVFTEGETISVNVGRTGGAGIFAGAASVRYLIGASVSAQDCDVDAQSDATFGDDYTSSVGRSGVLNWAEGDTDSQVIEISLIDDDEPGEADEQLSIVLCEAAPANAVELAGTSLANFTIVDPAQSGALAFAQSSLSVNENAGSLQIVVRREQPLNQAVSVDFTTVGGSAQPGLQYVAASGTLDFPVGNAEQTITLQLIDDPDTQSGSFSVMLENATAGVEITLDTATIDILDVTTPDQLEFVSTSFVTSEQNGQLAVPVRRAGNGFGDVSVQFRVVPGSATRVVDGAGDYSVILPMTTTDDAGNGLLIGTLNWPDGSAGETRSILIGINRDGEFETAEDFTIELISSSGAQIGSSASTQITIDDDPGASRIRFSDNDYRFSEDLSLGDSEVRGVTVVVSRVAEAESAGGPVAVRYQTGDLTAQAGVDYTATTGTLTWAADETGDKSFFVPVASDDIIEGNEQFDVSLVLVSGDNVLLDDPSTVTILDDSSANTPVLLSYALVNEAGEVISTGADPALDVSEGEDSQVRLRVTRGGGLQGLLTMQFAFGAVGDTASVSDHDGVAGTLQWGQGEGGDRFVAFNVLDDNFFEGTQPELLTVRLERAQVSWPGIVPAPSNTLIQQPDGNLVVRISDNETNILLGDDVQPTYWLEAVTEANLDQQATPPVELEALQVRVLTSDRTALVPSAQISWSVLSDPRFPVQQVAELLAPDGSSLGTDAVTLSDENGIATVRVRLLRRGFSAVRATPVANLPVAKRQIQNAAPQLAASDGDVIFRFAAGLQVAEALTPNQASVARTIDFLCDAFIAGEAPEPAPPIGDELPSPARQLFELCDLEDEDEPEIATSLQALAPEEVFTLGDATIEMADLQVTNIYQRLNAIRSGQTGGDVDLSGLGLKLFGEQLPGGIIAAAVDELSGGGASNDDLITNWGFFANGAFSVGRARSTENEIGQKFDTRGLTAGVDYRLRDDIVVGGALGHTNHESEFVSDSGYNTLDGTYLTFFGTWYKINRGYVDGVLEIGRNSFDIRRRINLNLVDPEDGSLLQDTVAEQFADGDVSALSTSLTLSAGLEYSGNGVEFGPYGRLSLSNATVEGYRERVVNPENIGEGYLLDVQEHDVRSTRLALGGQVQKTFSSSRGVFIPQLRIEAQYEAQKRPDGITATFQYDPTSTPFTVNADDNESLVVNYGLGGSAVFANGRSAYLYYEGQAGHDTITRHWLKGGFRVEF